VACCQPIFPLTLALRLGPEGAQSVVRIPEKRQLKIPVILDAAQRVRVAAPHSGVTSGALLKDK